MMNKHKETSPDSSWEIKRWLPWYRRKATLVSGAVIAISVMGSYGYLNYTLYSTHKRLKDMSQQYEFLQQEFLLVKTAKVKLQRELEVSKQSQTEIKSNLLSLHQQSQDLTEQLDLYKRIMSANRTSESVLVENLQVRPLEQDNSYVLSWVMLQASKKRNLLQGTVNLRVQGKLGDSFKTLNYSQIAVNKKNNLNYKFRDFQYFTNKIVLPKDFNVSDIIIEVSDNKTKITKSKTFNVTMLGRKINVAQTQDQSSRFKANS